MQKSPYAVTGKATKKLAGKDSERLDYEQHEGFFYVKTESDSAWRLANAEDYKKITKQHYIPRKSATTKDVAKPIKETAKPNEDTAQKKQEAKARQSYYDSEEWQTEYTELTKDVKPKKKRGFFSALAFWRGDKDESGKSEKQKELKPVEPEVAKKPKPVESVKVGPKKGPQAEAKESGRKRGFFSALAFWRGSDEKSEKGEKTKDVKAKPREPEKVVEVKAVAKPVKEVKVPVARKPEPAENPASVVPEVMKPLPEKMPAKPDADEEKVGKAQKEAKQEKKDLKPKEKKGFFSFLGLGSGSDDKPEAGKPVAEPLAGKDADKPETIEAAESKAPESLEKPDQETAEKGAVVKPGFVIKVLVLASGRKEVDEKEKRISADGYLTLPLVGSIKADGMTMRALSDHLTELYSRFLREPMVDVDFVLDSEARGGSPWGYVTVLGRVKQPGRVKLPPTKDLTLSTAIQLAGGFDKSAKMTGIKITRKEKGETKQFEIDLQSIGDEGNIKSDILLSSGDFVYVPERMF